MRKEQADEEFEEADEPPERIAPAEERMERLNLEPVTEGAVCEAFWHATAT